MIDHAEEWRPVVGHEGFYEVSSLGRVRVLPRLIPWGAGTKMIGGHLLRTAPGGRTGQYLRVQLHRPARRFAFVHRIVCEAFYGPPPFDGALVLHNDDDSHNNTVTNLRWGDRDDNEVDRAIQRWVDSHPHAEPAPF